jgi:outer membrane protein assembly factor BamB
MNHFPLLGEQYVYFGGQSDQNIYAVDIASGSLAWSKSGYSTFYSTAFALLDNRLYVPDLTSGVFVLDAASGAPVWGQGSWARGCSLSFQSDRIFGMIGTDQRSLVALDINNGQVLWSYSGIPQFAWIVSDAQRVYTHNNDNHLIALNAGDGSLAWQNNETVGYSANFAMFNGRLYAPLENGGIAAVDTSSGETVWARGGSKLYGLIGANNILYATGGPTTALMAYSPDTGELLWSYALSGYVNDAVVAGDVLYVATFNQDANKNFSSHVYAFVNQ